MGPWDHDDGTMMRFAERRLLKVYIEESDYQRLETKAGGNLGEYVRKLILEDLDAESGKNRKEGVPGAETVLSAERSTGAIGGYKAPTTRVEAKVTGSEVRGKIRNLKTPMTLEEEMAVDIAKGAPTCLHGMARGYRCWQCGGMAQTK